MKLYSPNHGNSKDRETDIYKENKYEILYNPFFSRALYFVNFASLASSRK